MVAQAVYLPNTVQRGAVINHIDTTEIQNGDSELEIRIKRATFPRRSWQVSYNPDDVLAVEQMFRVFQRAVSFLFQPPRPIDYTVTGHPIGIGDAVKVIFQLAITETLGTITVVKPILHPRTGTVHIFLDGVETFAFTYAALGVVTMTSAPGVGVVITASFLYDTAVRFDSADLATAITQALPGDPDGATIQMVKQATIIEVFGE